ncbi:hypothetical protein BZM27_54280, partial [Paraburkholderia steynii]
FILRDTDPETHIEVYGMNGVASYEARKREKQALRARAISSRRMEYRRGSTGKRRAPASRIASPT